MLQDGDLLVGAAGPFTNRGALFKRELIDDLDADQSWYNSPVESLLEGQTGPPPATKFYSYLGRSLC